ncbi:MAG: gamma-glutamyltransferase [Hyphomicrobiales bacterium]|nr:gamma-glutamyltransferase [Hyphomicrobiales bacterium]
MMRVFAAVTAIVCILALSACSDQRAGMVSTANPHASEAAAQMLRDGGSAVDAAIAAQMVLTLVEPQSSGIGGGLFLMHWDAAKSDMSAWDGREMAPSAAGPDLFLKDDGEPMKWTDASVGGRAVGVPGAVAALWAAHQEFGKLEWKALFAPAIKLAEEGFAISPRMHSSLAAAPALTRDSEARALYFDTVDGQVQPKPAGHVLRNPALAATLKRIAERGRDGFYAGVTAQQIVIAVRSHAGNPGLMDERDLNAYVAKRREPVCGAYRVYRVCGMPPPTSGGLTTLMILGMLENYHIAEMRADGPQALHLLTQASRLAYADRGLYMADNDFVDVPVAGLLDKDYLRLRARLIHPFKDTGGAEPGMPPGAKAGDKAADAGLVEYGTSHLAIVDGDGNAVSMTTSVEQRFGAHIMAGGFILNNQLTDFSFRPQKDGRPVANRVEAGKRPRSSMSPTLVLNDDGSFYAAIGSPGGSRIITFVTQTLIGLVDWNMTMQQAIDMPRALNRNWVTELEEGHGLEATAAALERMGHEVKVQKLNSGLHGIRRVGGKLEGGADRRREGVVIQVGG